MGTKSAMMANFNAKESVAQQYNQPFWLHCCADDLGRHKKKISIPHVVRNRSIDSLLCYIL